MSIMESRASANVDMSKFFYREDLKALETNTKRKRDNFILLKMLEEGDHADLTLTARDGSVKAHRSVLACVSPVFRAMFQHPMKEQLSSTVNIPDMTIEALRLFLLLLYTTNDLDIERCAEEMPLFEFAILKHVVQLCRGFNKYQVNISGIRSTLEYALLRQLRPENCLACYGSLLKLESEPELSGLLRVTKKYIMDNYSQVVHSPKFVEELKRNPEQVYQLIKSAEDPQVRSLVAMKVNGTKYCEDCLAKHQETVKPNFWLRQKRRPPHLP